MNKWVVPEILFYGANTYTDATTSVKFQLVRIWINFGETHKFRVKSMYTSMFLLCFKQRIFRRFYLVLDLQRWLTRTHADRSLETSIVGQNLEQSSLAWNLSLASEFSSIFSLLCCTGPDVVDLLSISASILSHIYRAPKIASFIIIQLDLLADISSSSSWNLGSGSVVSSGLQSNSISKLGVIAEHCPRAIAHSLSLPTGMFHEIVQIGIL